MSSGRVWEVDSEEHWSPNIQWRTVLCSLPGAANRRAIYYTTNVSRQRRRLLYRTILTIIGRNWTYSDSQRTSELTKWMTYGRVHLRFLTLFIRLLTFCTRPLFQIVGPLLPKTRLSDRITMRPVRREVCPGNLWSPLTYTVTGRHWVSLNTMTLSGDRYVSAGRCHTLPTNRPPRAVIACQRKTSTT